MISIDFDGKKLETDDFVCVACEGENVELFYNTDVLTLGMAVQMITTAYHEALDKLSEEEQEKIKEALSVSE